MPLSPNVKRTETAVGTMRYQGGIFFQEKMYPFKMLSWAQCLNKAKKLVSELKKTQEDGIPICVVYQKEPIPPSRTSFFVSKSLSRKDKYIVEKLCEEKEIPLEFI